MATVTPSFQDSHSPSRLKRYIVGGILLFLGVLVAIGVYWLYSNTVGGQSSLHGVRYLAGSFSERTLYEVGWRGPKPVTLPLPGRIIEYARSDAAEVAIVVSENNAQQVYRIIDGSATVVVSDGQIKSAPAVSPEGDMIAFAVRIATSSPTEPELFYAPDAWQIHCIRISDGASCAAGKGYGPTFFNRDGAPYLAYTTAKGIHIINLATNTHQDVAASIPSQIGRLSTVISPDGQDAVLLGAARHALFTLNKDEAGIFSFAYRGALPDSILNVAFGEGNYLVGSTYSGRDVSLSLIKLPEVDVIVHQEVIPQVAIHSLIP